VAGELEAVVRELLAALDRNDAEGIMRTGADDIVGIDEISRRWLLGREAVAAYVRQLVTAVQDVRSELRDVHELTWGDSGLVTCWLEQDYPLQGTRQHISAPTSVVLRREAAGWRIVLFHSIPLPEGAPA
jgi:uncharacterized protein (TIGR02246 family)